MLMIAQGFISMLSGGEKIRPAVACLQSPDGPLYQGGLEIDGMFAKTPEQFKQVDEAIEAAIDAFDYWARTFGGMPKPLHKAGR